MRDHFYTATYKVTGAPAHPSPSADHVTVILDGIHPAMFFAAYPHVELVAESLLHWAPLTADEHRALATAYRAMDGERMLYDVARVHGILMGHVREDSRRGQTRWITQRRLAGLLAYAEEAGIELPQDDVGDSEPATA
jgi:hypothetical protein